jgi:hypothetical protein
VQRRTGLGSGVLAVGATTLVAFVATAGSQTPSAQPLTKQEYFDQSLHYMDEESHSERLYYKVAVHELPRSKCAASARKYQGKLAHMVDEAAPVIPPPEIADIHGRLLTEAGGIVRKAARVAKQAKTGRWVCGDDLEHPRPNEISDRIYRIYRRSGLEPTLQQLRDLGYLPSGE